MKHMEALNNGLKAWERVLLRDGIEEHVGNLKRWPTRIGTMLLSKRIHFKERLQLTLFVLANKCPPTVYVKWLLRRGMLRDVSARNHIKSIILGHKTGKLEADGRTAYVIDATLPNGDEAKGKVMPVYTPSFAYDPLEHHYWDDAVDMLMKNVMSDSESEPEPELNVFVPLDTLRPPASTGPYYALADEAEIEVEAMTR